MRTLLNVSRVIGAAALLGLAAGNAVAQTRHDEKPHGKTQPAVKSAGHAPPHTSGRHSDMMHGGSAQPATSPRSDKDTPTPASSRAEVPAPIGASPAVDSTKK